MRSLYFSILFQKIFLLVGWKSFSFTVTLTERRRVIVVKILSPEENDPCVVTTFLYDFVDSNEDADWDPAD